MVVGYHHFRKPPYVSWPRACGLAAVADSLWGWVPITMQKDDGHLLPTMKNHKCLNANPKHCIRTQIPKILVAMPPALPVPCWLLLSVPYARNCRIHRGDEEPQKATQVFRIDQLCLNGREAAFLGSSLKMFSWLLIVYRLSKNACLELCGKLNC